MFASITYGTFIFFGSMTVIGGVYVYLFLPETKGVSLEQMDTLFAQKGFAKQQMRLFKEIHMDAAVIEGQEGNLADENLAKKEDAMF